LRVEGYYICFLEPLLPVTHPRYPLRINVGFLINQPIGTSRDIHFEFAELHLDTDFDVTGFSGIARISRTPQGLLVQGDFQAQVELECVRCLTEFGQHIHSTFNELYAFKYKGVTESGLLVPEDGNINLGPLVREYLLLEVPISPLCKSDCKGLCTVCGADLNVEPCEHQAMIKTD
jgi:uncharacterized protein